MAPKLSEMLPAEFEGREKFIERFKDDPLQVVNSYRSLESQFSQGTRVPGKDAGQEEWSKFFRHLGTPEKADEYAVPEAKDKMVSDVLGQIRETALKSGLTKKQFDEVAGAIRSIADQRHDKVTKEFTDARAAAEAKLKETFGKDYEAKMVVVKDVMSRLEKDFPASVQTIKAAKLDTDAGFIELMSKVGSIVSEGPMPRGNEGQGGPGAKLPEADAVKIAQEAIGIVGSGDMQNRTDPTKKAKATERYFQIQHKLVQEGYSGIMDPRLRPREAEYQAPPPQGASAR